MFSLSCHSLLRGSRLFGRRLLELFQRSDRRKQFADLVSQVGIVGDVLVYRGAFARAPPLELASVDDGRDRADQEAACQFDQTPAYDKP